MNKITFETIKKELSIDELFRFRIDLTNDISDCHIDLHDGNHHHEKSGLLATINECKELIEYVNERIKTRRNEIYIENKERSGGLRKFKDLVKQNIDPELFARLDAESKIRN